MGIIKFHLSSSLMAVLTLGLCGLSALADAGTLSWQAVNATGTGNGEYGASGAPLTDTASYAAGSSKKGTTAESGGETFTITIKFTGASGEAPPSSVLVNYPADTKGSVSYNLIGSPTPSGSVSGMYKGSVVKIGTTYTLSDSFNVAQGMNPQNDARSQGQDVSNDGLSTPSDQWTAGTTNPDGTVTSTITVTLLKIFANTSASAPISSPIFPNYATAEWDFELDIQDITITAG